MNDTPGTVYLLHSTVPLVLPNGREVRHYLGWTAREDVYARIREHEKNRHSAKIVQAFLRAGGELVLGNKWAGATPEDERRMKRAGHLGAKCLYCKFLEAEIAYLRVSQ